MNDNNSELEESKIDRQLRRVGDGDLSQKIGRAHDDRFSALIKWFWGFLGTMFVAGVYWVAASINNLNTSVVRILAQNEAMLETQRKIEVRLDRQEVRADVMEDRLMGVQREVSTLNGRNMRGASGH